MQKKKLMVLLIILKLSLKIQEIKKKLREKKNKELRKEC